MKQMACLVCGELASVESYGYTFCEKHKKFADIDPEDLEILIIWRLEGKPVEEIENLLNKLYQNQCEASSCA